MLLLLGNTTHTSIVVSRVLGVFFFFVMMKVTYFLSHTPPPPIFNIIYHFCALQNACGDVTHNTVCIMSPYAQCDTVL